MNATIENEYKKMEDKLQKYSEKIKELFQNLIHEKRRNAGLNPPPNISNSLNLRKLEQHGELDYLNSTTHLHHREGHNRIKFSHEQSLEQKSCGVETFENSPSLRKGMEGGDAVYASRC
jgi:ribosomal protein L16 Arg81 hydroxylase